MDNTSDSSTAADRNFTLHSPGDLIDERYRVNREVARGETHVFYEVEDTMLSERLVLKRLLSTQSNPNLVTGFIQVGNASRKFSGRSKRFVPVHTLERDDYGPYLILDLITAPTLRTLMKDGEIASLDSAIKILREIALGLADLHQEGYVHRDIKPDNIFMLDGGDVLLADFGIPKHMASSPGTMQSVGLSHIYSSPEQAKGLPTTQASDIYAFGAVTYELFSGDAPYGVIEPLVDLVPGIPQAVSDLVMRCLAMRPERRPQNGAELVAALSDSTNNVRPSQAFETTQPTSVQTVTSADELPAPQHIQPIIQHNATVFSTQRWQDKYPALAQYIADLRPIPGGEFWMGARDDDEFLDPDYDEEEDEDGEGPLDFSQDARPRHRVRLSPFRLGRTLVTVSVWMEYCSDNGLSMPDAPVWGWIPDHPVVNVSWDDIMGVDGNGGFCAWATRTLGFAVMLPTEAQWEYAAAGGDTGYAFPWGDTYRDQFGWTGCEVSRVSTASVRRTSNVYTNSFGLTDMIGNVLQWCLDAYASYPVEEVQVVRSGVRQVPANGLAGMLGKTVVEHFEYVDTEERVPAITVDPRNDNGEDRCVRGGSWSSYDPVFCRCAYRGWDGPGYTYLNYGFRLSAGPG